MLLDCFYILPQLEPSTTELVAELVLVPHMTLSRGYGNYILRIDPCLTQAPVFASYDPEMFERIFHKRHHLVYDGETNLKVLKLKLWPRKE